MPVLFMLLLFCAVGPFFVEDPLVRHRLIGFLVATGVLIGLLKASTWFAGELQMDRDTDRSRQLAAFARLLVEQGEQPGRVMLIGRATQVSGSWRGRPFRLQCAQGQLAWELLATGSPVELQVWRPRWLPGLFDVQTARGGTESAWRRPGPGRAEVLAKEALSTHAFQALEVWREMVVARGPLSTSSLEPSRLLYSLQGLAAIAELVAPRATGRSTGRL